MLADRFFSLRVLTVKPRTRTGDVAGEKGDDNDFGGMGRNGSSNNMKCRPVADWEELLNAVSRKHVNVHALIPSHIIPSFHYNLHASRLGLMHPGGRNCNCRGIEWNDNMFVKWCIRWTPRGNAMQSCPHAPVFIRSSSMHGLGKRDISATSDYLTRKWSTTLRPSQRIPKEQAQCSMKWCRRTYRQIT